MDDNAVYYKIYKAQRIDNKLTVVCMQWFDECDYDSERFFRDRDGNILRFDEEKDAIEWLHDNIKESMIDPEYLDKRVIKDEEYFK